MAGLLNIGLTGLNAAQAGLLTTGHNISNVGTVGFNRQSVQQTTNDPQFSGVGFFGQGTRIETIKRSFNQFLENQVLSADNRRAEFEAFGAQIGQINNLLADPEAGLAPALENFFAGVQEVAANPSDVPARQAMISSAQALVSRFQILDTRLSEIRDGTESEIAGSVDQINTLASAIAEMNQKILVAQSAGPDIPANDLQDQRNVLIAELNQLIKVTTVPEDDGSLSVFIGSGQSLVLGQQVSRLGALRSTNDPNRLAVSLISQNGSATEIPENLLNGGRLGGLLAFRREGLDPARNQLGLSALALAEAFNAQHRLGSDLDGVIGQDFFASPAIAVSPAGAVTVAIAPQGLGALTGSGYELINEDGTNFTLIRLSDRTRVINNAPLPATIDGLQLSGVTLGIGQSALIEPTRFAARDLSVAITDVRKVAAGAPVLPNVPLSNGGTGRIESLTINSTAGMVTAPSLVPNFAPITLNFAAATNTLAGLPAGFTLTSGTPPVADNGFNPVTNAVGKRFTLTSPAGFAFSFTVAGTPSDGDAFTFAPTDGGVADNRNASLLGALQTSKILFASASGVPSATLQSAYAQLVSNVGNKTREVQVGERSQQALLLQATEARDALSGVNLDEEAANLLRFQQAYQAAGRVIAVSQRLFDDLIAIVR
jgi:flagellar hook-associated protein 1 FlgK